MRAGASPVSIAHHFVGYKPLVLAFHDEKNSLGNENVCLHFFEKSFVPASTWMTFPADMSSVARIVLSPVNDTRTGFKPFKLYSGVFGHHYFMNPVHQRLNRIRERFRKSREGNVDLPGNLYDMIRIAYALPRTIALVTVMRNEKMNLFPTDLHGKINEQFYVSSLRIGGKAQQQVESTGRIVLSEVQVDSYREVYQLGKNHMNEMLEIDSFNVSPAVSEKYGFPIPRKSLRYFELHVVDFIDIGIHRIFMYRIENEVSVSTGKTLAHIHQYYAQWRLSQGMENNYFLR